MAIRGFLNFIPSHNFRLVMCGTGLVIAAAGTVHLVRRLRRRAEFEDSQNRTELPDDQSHPTDAMVILEQDAEETRVVACQQIYTNTWWELAIRGCIIGAPIIAVVAVIRLGYMKRFIASLRFPSAFALAGTHRILKVTVNRRSTGESVDHTHCDLPMAFERGKFLNQLTAARGNLRIIALNIARMTGSAFVQMVATKLFIKGR